MTPSRTSQETLHGIGVSQLPVASAAGLSIPLRVLSVFAGIGGIDLGLERTGGFKTVAFCEIGEFPRRVLKKHWPAVPCVEDVRNLNFINGQLLYTYERSDTQGLYDLRHWVCDGPIDVICGGFPCQDISNAGKRAGLSGERSSLWFEFDRLVGEVRPKFVIVENVGALSGRGLDAVLACLAARGYDAEWQDIPAAFVGAPHWRSRQWIVAYPERGERRQEPYLGSLGRMGRLQKSFPWDRDWQAALSEFRGVDDGLPRSVASTDAYRNAVVPQIPEMIGNVILQHLEASR